MFLVVAQNGKQYGPFTAEQVKEWIEKGWLTEKSKIKDENENDWKAISDFPIFSKQTALPSQKNLFQFQPLPIKETPKTPPSSPIQKQEIPQPITQKNEEPLPEIVPPPEAPSKNPFRNIPLVIAHWSILAVISILLSCVSIFWWKGILSILAIVFGHLACIHIKKNPEVKGRIMAIAGFILGYITLALVAFNLLTITIPSIQDGKENLRRMQIIQDSIDHFGPTTQEYQCWNASGLKISYVDGVILNSSETQRVVNSILTLDSFKSENIPVKELTPANLVLMRIGHISGSYAWRIVCYRRNPKGYGIDRKGRSMKPEAFSELQIDR